MRRVIAAAAAALTIGAAPPPAAVPELGARLERFAYPWPVETMPVTMGTAPTEMAFMDVAPATPNGQTIVLLHGKNFCGATWETTARALLGAGYRVLIPDQIGFCKSGKPPSAQYSLAMMAATTRALMARRGIDHAVMLGHSMGGMLAIRFALQYPESVERLVLVDPLGLVDRASDGVPYMPISDLLAGTRKTDAASIKAYQRANYYHGTWQPAYDRWVAMLAGMYAGAGREQVALAQAKTSEMIYTQPVAAELDRLAMPVTLIVGALDKTAFGRAQAPAAVQARLKPIPDVAPAAARRMRAHLITLDGLGHSPQVEDPARFNRTLLAALAPR